MQLVFSTVSLSAMTIGQLQLAVAAAGFASLLASVSFTLFLSSRCQNTVAALALALLFFLSPIIFIYGIRREWNILVTVPAAFRGCLNIGRFCFRNDGF